jgi:hypothetical protein
MFYRRYFMSFIISKKSTKAFTFVLTLALLISQFIFFPNYAEGAEVELLITGTGINEEVSVTSDDWDKYTMVERTYSANNSLNFHKIIKTKGYDLFELIGEDNLKTDQDYEMLFICSDGFEFTKTVEELKNLYFFRDFTETSMVSSKPILAKYSLVLADYPKDSFNPPINWEDQAISEDDLDTDFPKLVFGQKDIDDMNLSKWGKEVVKIVIGDEIQGEEAGTDSPYKHISYDGAPYNVDAISGATFTIEGPALDGYRAISLRQIEEDIDGQSIDTYYEEMDGEVLEHTYEGINAKYLIDNYVNINTTPGNVIFRDKSRQKILEVPFEEVENYKVAYGINELPLVYLNSDVGYRANKYNDNGCFKLVYKQTEEGAVEFSNVAYMYIEEKDAKNIYEHTYSPYDNPKYRDYEIIIQGNSFDGEVRYTVEDIESMDHIKYEDEYSLSNSEYFWYYNTYKGVTLWDLLLEAGLDPDIDEDTSIQFIAADNYNFQPLTIGDIKDSSLYGYYEKDPEDLGDGSFDGKNVEPLHSNMPPLVAYGFNGYPYVIRPTDEGFNPGLGNDGGPLRVIFGKRNYTDTNGSNQVQFLKEIIVGGGESVYTGEVEEGSEGENTSQIVNESNTWNHNQGVYKDYLDQPVLRVTGSQVKKPMTFTLSQIESILEHSVRDVYTGDGINEYEGIVLWDLISEVVKLKEDVDVPSIRIFSGANYNQILRSFDQVSKGVVNSKGETKQIILAYAREGYPLVPNESSIGYANNNAYGPLRLIVEESKSMWVKWVDCIVVGTGEYEEPKMEDVVEMDLPELPSPESEQSKEKSEKLWLDFKNNTGKEMTEASVRAMEYDSKGNLWIGTNNGGISVRSPEGKWTHIKEVTLSTGETVEVDTSYAIVQRENGQLWITLGSPTEPKGILVKEGNNWSQYTTDNSDLPSCFVQELELDGNGGLWIGSKNGVVYVDSVENWTLYTEKEGLLPYSVDALEPDGQGGVWIGYYPNLVENNDGTTSYIGGYQHMHSDGSIDTYQGFDKSNFNINWVRSISMDSEGGVWIVRSGNAPGFGHGEIDYIKNDERTVYKTEDLYPDIKEDDDIRLLLTDKNNKDVFYIATLRSGVIKSEGVGNISEKYNGSTVFTSNQWNNAYFIDWSDDNLMIGTNGGAAVQANRSTFDDIKSHWAENEVEKMTTLGYLKGSDGNFRPDESITRAEFVTLMVRILGLKTDKSETRFTDVSSDDWFAPYISSAVSQKIVKGYDDGSFKPNNPITREEISSLLSTVLDLELSEKDTEKLLEKFNDKVSPWAETYVAKSVEAGLLNGFPDGTFKGSTNATRAQSAVMLLRFLSN